eukprot:g17943.t1
MKIFGGGGGAGTSSPPTVPRIRGFERASFSQKAPRVKYVLPPRAPGAMSSDDQSDYGYNNPRNASPPVAHAKPASVPGGPPAVGGGATIGGKAKSSALQPSAIAGAGTTATGGTSSLFPPPPSVSGNPQSGGNSNSNLNANANSADTYLDVSLASQGGIPMAVTQNVGPSKPWEPEKRLSSAQEPVPAEDSLFSGLRQTLFGSWSCCQVEMANRDRERQLTVVHDSYAYAYNQGPG